MVARFPPGVDALQRVAVIVLALVLYACGGGQDAPTTGVVSTPDARAEAPDTSIVAWGDSLTFGDFASSTDASYPAQLARLTGRVVLNKGVSGQTSREIAARQGGAPALITLQGDLIPPAGPALIRYVSASPVAHYGGSIEGRLAGIHGGLTQTISGDAFTRDDTGPAVHVAPGSPFLTDNAWLEAVNVFWLGRNNFWYEPDQVVLDLQACADFLRTDQYIVLSILNGAGEGRGTAAYDQIMTLNHRLAQAFPGHYLDVRNALVERYDPNDAQDRIDHSQDVPPASLRGDPMHPNDSGYRVVAELVAAFMEHNRW